jgi:hypothetical protein
VKRFGSREAERLLEGECPGFAKETTMLKCIGLTALATAVAVLTLGCVRGLGSPTAPAADQIYMAKPMSPPAVFSSSEVTVRWRDIGIYRASGPLRVGGDQDTELGPVALHDVPVPLPAGGRGLRPLPVDPTGGSPRHSQPQMVCATFLGA